MYLTIEDTRSMKSLTEQFIEMVNNKPLIKSKDITLKKIQKQIDIVLKRKL